MGVGSLVGAGKGSGVGVAVGAAKGPGVVGTGEGPGVVGVGVGRGVGQPVGQPPWVTPHDVDAHRVLCRALSSSTLTHQPRSWSNDEAPSNM